MAAGQMIPWVGGMNQHRANEVSNQLCTNFYVEAVDAGDPKSATILIGTPGTKIWNDFTAMATGTSRGTYVASTGDAFVTLGGTVYKMTYDGISHAKNLISICEIGDQLSEVYFADDGFHMLFADGSAMYSYDLNAGGQAIYLLNQPFLFPMKVLYFGNRFVAVNKDDNIGDTSQPAKIARNNNKYFWSDAGADGYLTWDGTSYETAKSSSTPILNIDLCRGELWIIKESSYEVVRATYDMNAPYAVVGGSSNKIGTTSPYSVKSISDQLFWLGSSDNGRNQIFKSGTGYDAQRISTHALEYQLSKLEKDLGTAINDWRALTYQEEGHTFYIMSSDMANVTWAYDLTTLVWAQRTTKDALNNIENRWMANHILYAFGKLLVVDHEQPIVLELSLDNYRDYMPSNGDDGGRAMTSVRQGPPLWGNLQQSKVLEFIVDMSTGVGTHTIGSLGYNPQAMMQVSRDGGNNFGAEQWAPIGGEGQFGYRVRWRGLGQSRSMVLKLTISEPIKKIIMGANLTTERGLYR